MDNLTKRLAKSLYDVLYELHPTHPHTAWHTGGVGGQAFTQCCHVLSIRASEKEDELVYKADTVLREAFLQAEQEREPIVLD